jgi:AcrR family transcriptional regulator
MSATSHSAPAPDRRSVPESVARPKQARSRATLVRILDVAEALIEEKGLSDASIPEIVRRAGSSVGGFYARFRDKNELLRALEERFFLELSQRLAEISNPARWARSPIPVVIRACVDELVRTFRERQALIRMFLVRAGGDRDALDEGLRFRRQVSQRMLDLLRPRRAEIGHEVPERAIDVAVHLAFGLMHQAAVFGELRAGERPLSDAEIADELTRNFLAYLEIPRPAPDRSSP